LGLLYLEYYYDARTHAYEIELSHMPTSWVLLRRSNAGFWFLD